MLLSLSFSGRPAQWDFRLTSCSSRWKEASASVVDVVNLGARIKLSPNPRIEEAAVGMDLPLVKS